MTTAEDDAYTEYVTAKMQWVRGVAYLLCQDWHRADELGQITITKLYVHWGRIAKVANLDGYVRAILVNTFLAEQRSPRWKRVVPHRSEPTAATTAESQQDVESVLDLRSALKTLPPRQRAAVVMRYYSELSVQETAEALGCSPGTVKSQTARALASLRQVLEERQRESPVPNSPTSAFTVPVQTGGNR